MCPKCVEDKFFQLGYNHLHDRAKCSSHISLTVWSVFKHVCFHTLFVATYPIGTDKDEISAGRFSKMVGMGWPNAYRMLMTSCKSMSNRDYQYRRDGIVEMDEWSLNVHLGISNFGNFLAKTFHEVSHRYLLEYVGELFFSFNHRFLVPMLPDLLLHTVVDRVPTRTFHTYS